MTEEEVPPTQEPRQRRGHGFIGPSRKTSQHIDAREDVRDPAVAAAEWTAGRARVKALAAEARRAQALEADEEVRELF
eukprot:8294927-Pyramimonas_sp.AAC.1